MVHQLSSPPLLPSLSLLCGNGEAETAFLTLDTLVGETANNHHRFRRIPLLERFTGLPDSTKSRVTLTLPSTLESVSRAEQEAEMFAQRAGFSEDEIGNIAMAVRECTVNAVLHGNAYSPDKQVQFSLEMAGSEMRVAIADQGAGFDPDSLPDPLAPENIMRGSGRGIFLTRAFMDEVHFRRLDPGTEITLIKRLSETSGPIS
ncbi:MAG: ATP-binding protein [Acidobacteria bacterium]|nr:ATP-binding protein [Acidobacteriota bacterium]